ARDVDLPGVCARLQHRGAREPPAPAPQRGAPRGPPQAALQRGRQPLVDLRRRPLRVRVRGRQDSAPGPEPPRGRRGERRHVGGGDRGGRRRDRDRKSTRLNSSHVAISYAVFCLKKKKKKKKKKKNKKDNGSDIVKMSRRDK